MKITKRFKHIWAEMMCHLPFTAGGAAFGIIFMLIFKNMGQDTGSVLFKIFHPAHVVLSAMVTSSLFLLHTKKRNFFVIVLVGYFGAVGIATLSDCIIPFFGEEILHVSVPSHSALHEAEESHLQVDNAHEVQEHEEHAHDDHIHGDTGIEGNNNSEHVHDENCEHHNHEHGLHLGFIEQWYIVNPAALLGIIFAWYMPSSRYPHGVHVLISTWASSSHMLMNTTADITTTVLFGMFIVLFIAVWLPCCVSDILFPLLFVKGDIDISCRCSGGHNVKHSHDSESHCGCSAED